jgi:UDP-N-acetylglucosamine 2-epimerase (non-hydrolysing)
MAPVIKEFANHRDSIESRVCVTGQHREMLDQVLGLFEVKPDHDLHVMEPDQRLSHLTAKMIERLEPVVEELKPTWVLAEGDTATVLVAGLVSYYHKIRFGHVEAGLRTSDKYRPYPEEMNRRLADVLADALFAPTERNRQTLIKEGIPNQRILLTGNTVIDALFLMEQRSYDWNTGPLAKIPHDKEIVLVTAHRRESFGEPLRNICLAVKQLASRLSGKFVFVYPVHLNPNVRVQVEQILSNVPNVNLIDPLDYVSMVQLMKRSRLILTDSGGIQEEAPSLGIPVLVMREKTERSEIIDAGVARLVGRSTQRIVQETLHLLDDPETYSAMAKRVNIYGDGKAAARIVSFLLEH